MICDKIKGFNAVLYRYILAKSTNTSQIVSGFLIVFCFGFFWKCQICNIYLFLDNFKKVNVSMKMMKGKMTHQ